MSKITVEQFKLAGFELVVNDVVDGEELNVINAYVLNNSDIFGDKTIDKLVPRQEKGAQPSLKHLDSQMDKPVIEWKVGDKCYTDKRLVQCTFVGAMADGVNCVLQDYDADMLVVPIAELERVVDADREKAIDELEGDYKDFNGSFREFLGAIYDKGYRK